mgnify:CR=1 FL=1
MAGEGKGKRASGTKVNRDICGDNRGVIKKAGDWCGITGDRYFAAMAVGAINWGLFACPVNAIVLVVYIIALVAMHLLRKRVYLFGWLSHYSAAVSSLVWVVGMTVIMGLIRQAPSGHASNDILGFSQMISSWPFVLLYFGWSLYWD